MSTSLAASLPNTGSCTVQLNHELSYLKDDLSRIKQKYQEKSNELLAKRFELQRRAEKKQSSVSSSEAQEQKFNMMQKLERVMEWAKKLDTECTETKRERKLHARRHHMKHKRHSVENFPPQRAVSFAPQNQLRRVDNENYMLDIPQKRMLSDITNNSNAAPARDSYMRSLQADIDELSSAMKYGSQKRKPALIRRMSEADMPLVMQKQHARKQPSPLPPSGPAPEAPFQRRFHQQPQQHNHGRRSVNDISEYSQYYEPASPPRRPRSEIRFNAEQKRMERAKSHEKPARRKSAFVWDDEHHERPTRKRRSKSVSKSKPRKKVSANAPPKQEKVKRLWAAPTPKKSPPRKNFRRLLSKSKKREIDRKMRALMR